MTFRTIKSVKVEPVADRDDDKIIIEFGTHDAAIGPFRIPEDDKNRGVNINRGLDARPTFKHPTNKGRL